MKKVLFVFSALLILSLGTSIVSAQTPNVQVFFDEYFGVPHLAECPETSGTTGYLYVVASNFNCWISAIEYMIEYPSQLVFIVDLTGGLDLGTSQIGLATTWPFPINGFSPVLVNKVMVTFNCQLCFDPNIHVTAVPHPDTGFLRIVRWSDRALINGVGMLSTICSTIPAEETTWGNIKALYN